MSQMCRHMQIFNHVWYLGRLSQVVQFCLEADLLALSDIFLLVDRGPDYEMTWANVFCFALRKDDGVD